jgi:hypothetical protein
MIGAMTIGERLLNLSAEYQEALARQGYNGAYGIEPSERTPAEIAADYEAAMLELIRTAPVS